MEGKCDVCSQNTIIFNKNVSEDVNVKYSQWQKVKENRIVKENMKEIKL